MHGTTWIRNLDGKYTAIIKDEGDEEVEIFCDLRIAPSTSQAKSRNSRYQPLGPLLHEPSSRPVLPRHALRSTPVESHCTSKTARCTAASASSWL